jgi:hypothetical protein
MKPFRTVVFAALFLLVAGLAWAQEEPRDENNKPRQEQPEAKPETKPEGKPQEQVKPKYEKQEPGKMDESRPADKRDEKNQKTETQGQAHGRPAGKSAHIPDEKFKANFGHQHTFTVTRVIQTTTIVPNQTTFVYGGYNFMFLDPWPAGWLMTDMVYIDFIDGEYFLLDAMHPGVQVALFVSL